MRHVHRPHASYTSTAHHPHRWLPSLELFKARSLPAGQPTYRTFAPRHCCTITVVCRARRSRCSTERASSEVKVVCGNLALRAHTALLLAVRRCLAACVYNITGCTAESSWVERGAWWWHCAHSCCSTVASSSHPTTTSTCLSTGSLMFGPIELIQPVELRVEHLVG
jgi:hypothetical protein